MNLHLPLSCVLCKGSPDPRAFVDTNPTRGVRYSDGSTEEEYLRNGKWHREDGPSLVRRFANGTTEETYHRDGKLHREGGPAYVRQGADGRTLELYYRHGEFVKEERLVQPSVVPGVTIQRSAPTTPVRPGAAGPS